MFEAGRTYSFVTIAHDGETHWSAKVVQVDGPLLKIEQFDGSSIINTHCSAFMSARMWSEEDERAAAEHDLDDLIARPPMP